jgi:hypothetical protein
MRELGPQLSAHREEKPKIEDFLEKMLGDPTFIKGAADAFFGLQMDEKNTAELTPDELADFTIFFLHVSKRVISAAARKRETSAKAKSEEEISITDLATLDSSKKAVFLSHLFHDVSHSVGQIARTGALTNNTAVQPFLRYESGKDYNSRELLEDELRGFIFASYYYPYPNQVRSKMHLDENDTEKDFIKSFVRSTIKAATRDNIHLIDEALPSFSLEAFRKRRVLEKEGKELAEDIIANPPQDVINSLHYIWEHKDNPRVLVDLFFMQIGPYIDALKKRKDYSQIASRTE